MINVFKRSVTVCFKPSTGYLLDKMNDSDGAATDQGTYK